MKAITIFRNMPSTSEASSPSLSGAIARSRSRYKGSRVNRLVISTQESLALSANNPRRLKDAARMYGRGGLNGHAETPASVVERASDHAQKLANHETLDVESHPRVRQDRWLRDCGEGDNTVGSPRRGEAGHTKTSVQEPQCPSEEPYREHRIYPHSRRSVEQSTDRRPVALPKKSFTQRVTGQTNEQGLSKSREELKRTISGPIAIEPPPSITAPAFDAPISAVNAGERRVTVKYGDFEMSIPVTPSTTSMDLVRLADEQILDSISEQTSVVEESYRQLGLERPLRKYERIRNVMNSWDNDMQNKLLIKPSPTGTDDSHEDLELNCVSRTQPGDTSLSIYHSQKPGHWDKRWVTLRPDGQILVAKKQGGESTNICHLSDFDVYVPTARQLSKKIRPPRRMCFAVKSQQKSSMFMTTENFVHFFSTSDRTLATLWYKAVQEWRSWYLVNVMGEGLENAVSPTNGIAKVDHSAPMGSQSSQNNHSRSLIGNAEQTVARVESNTGSPPVHSQGPLPKSYLKQLTEGAETGNPRTRREEEASRGGAPRRLHQPDPFAASGLLGRTYTQRQKVQQKLEISPAQEQNTNVPTPTDASPSGGLKRTSSQRPRTRPLIDLTPQYREPPQHAKKGRGIVPELIPAGGLVEIATSPEEAILVPPTTTWQRPGTSSYQERSPIHRSGTIHRDRSATTTGLRQKSQSPEKGEAPFTAGLLAGSSRGQDGTGAGRGIMTGDREAQAPMLDLTKGSDFAPGSFLGRVEMQNAGQRPIVDRGNGER